MGGSQDDKIHSDDNRIDLCVLCHRRAHAGDISTEALRRAKLEDQEWRGLAGLAPEQIKR